MRPSLSTFHRHTSYAFSAVLIVFNFCRVLIATIRDMGNCPCPRCKIPKTLIPEMGSSSDRERRLVLQRQDNKKRQDAVSQARTFINHKGYVVTSKHVENLLKPESLVPTEASRLCTRLRIRANEVHECRMRFLLVLVVSAWIFLFSSLSISCTNLSWAYGRLYCSI